MADKIRIAVAALLVVAGLAGFYFLADALTIWRVLSVLGGVIAGAFVFWTTAPGKQFAGYAHDSWDETRKVVWPTRKETVQTTAIVFAFVVVMAIFLWIVDASLLWIVKKLIGQGE